MIDFLNAGSQISTHIHEIKGKDVFIIYNKEQYNSALREIFALEKEPLDPFYADKLVQLKEGVAQYEYERSLEIEDDLFGEN